MMRRFLWVVLVLPAVLVAPAASGAESENASVAVTEDTTWVQDRLVLANLTVKNNATLRIEGAHVYVGGAVIVEENATLLLGPRGDTPAQLTSIPRDRFWIDVRGRIESAGEPRTIIEGLDGNGLDSVVQLPGGLKVSGTGDLRDIIIRNGTAGLIVERGGTLELQDATVQNLYLMGVAAVGEFTAHRVHFVDNVISVTGKGRSCSIYVEDSTFYSLGAHFQMNGCPLEARDLSMEGGSAAIVINGAGTYSFTNATMTGYKSTGLRGDGGSEIRLTNMTLQGAPQARDGIRLKPDNTLFLDGVILADHAKTGLEAQRSTVEARSSAFVRNGEYGVRLIDATWVGGVESLTSQDFGVGTAYANGQGAVDMQAVVTFFASDGADSALAGLNITVFDGAGEVLYTSPTASDSPSTLAIFPMLQEADGVLASRGPFRYIATHPLWSAPQEGEFDPAEGYVALEWVEVRPSEDGGGGRWLLIGLAAVAAVGLVLWKPASSRLRRGDAGEEDDGHGRRSRR